MQEYASQLTGDSLSMHEWMNKMPSWERLITLTFAIGQLETRIVRKEALLGMSDLSGKSAGRTRTTGLGTRLKQRDNLLPRPAFDGTTSM